MHIADLLSRTFTDSKGEEQKQQQGASTSQAGDMDIVILEDMEHVDAVEFTRVTDQQFVQIRELTKQDSQLQAPNVTIVAGWPGTRNETPLCIRKYWSYRDELTVHSGVIFRGNRVIIPRVLQPEMLKRIHASHFGAEAWLCKARDVIYWQTMNSEGKHFISNCTTCNDYLQNNRKEALISHPIRSKPWSQIVMDIMIFFGRNYLITVDLYSHFWELDTLSNNPTATSVI